MSDGRGGTMRIENTGRGTGVRLDAAGLHERASSGAHLLFALQHVELGAARLVRWHPKRWESEGTRL
jgi:hypothetical protein